MDRSSHLELQQQWHGRYRKRRGLKLVRYIDSNCDSFDFKDPLEEAVSSNITPRYGDRANREISAITRTIDM